MGNIEIAKDLGQGIYTQDEINNKPSGFKNYIINGRFDVWQRGTSFSINGETFNADRWLGWHQQGGTISASGGITGHYNAVVINGNSSGSAVLFQRIEASSTISIGTDGNTKMTVSFWAKADVAGSALQVKIRVPDTTDTWGTYTVPKEINVGTLGTSWAKYTATIDLDFVYWVGFALEIRALSGVTNFYVGAVQLEKGSVATPFEHRPYGLELSLCQRYFWRVSGNYIPVGFGRISSSSSTIAYGAITFPVPMRKNIDVNDCSGSIMFTDRESFDSVVSGWYSDSTSNTSLIFSNITLSSSAVTNRTAVISTFSSGSYFQVNAEL